jgi:hypothetical protein
MHSLAERKKLGKAATVPLIIGQPGPLIMLNPKREEHNLLSGKGSSCLSIKVWLCLLFSVAFCSHQLACVNDLAQGDESLYKPQLSFSARAVPIMRVTENRPDNLYQGDRVV